MNVYQPTDVLALSGFAQRSEKLGIVERDVPDGAAVFFEKLAHFSSGKAALVTRENAQQDVQAVLDDVIPKQMLHAPFCRQWRDDMADISRLFCDVLETQAICFWVGSQRGCRRYHVDNVAFRMLVTYSGKGTEWLPDEFADREAYASGAPNEMIVKDTSALQFIKPWDVAVFRGAKDGVLHRTPDEALEGPSVMMRLDHPTFWEDVLKHL